MGHWQQTRRKAVTVARVMNSTLVYCPVPSVDWWYNSQSNSPSHAYIIRVFQDPSLPSNKGRYLISCLICAVSIPSCQFHLHIPYVIEYFDYFLFIFLQSLCWHCGMCPCHWNNGAPTPFKQKQALLPICGYIWRCIIDFCS